MKCLDDKQEGHYGNKTGAEILTEGSKHQTSLRHRVPELLDHVLNNEA